MVLRSVDLSFEGPSHQEALPVNGKPPDSQKTNSSPPKISNDKKLVADYGGEAGFHVITKLAHDGQQLLGLSKLPGSNISMAGQDDQGASTTLVDEDRLQLLHGSSSMAISRTMLCGGDDGGHHED
ncbi:hypothetical protein AMTR_s00047p00134080 [Amborella trichopoda]|uniref:Uncharacterized protein n=1 Tax=Amborella trichopoda TaxID=13333 RepID=U5D6A6_AMBTC|nr:hypothetical protein AMTR_s00047p00134080 [Amborella trichopoda]